MPLADCWQGAGRRVAGSGVVPAAGRDGAQSRHGRRAARRRARARVRSGRGRIADRSACWRNFPWRVWLPPSRWRGGASSRDTGAYDETVDPADAAAWQALLASLNGADLVFELSGDMAALNQAIEAAGFDGRIVVGSWYGASARAARSRRPVPSQPPAPHFEPGEHARTRRSTGRWDKPRRIELAWRMVEKLEPQRLIGQSFSACAMPAGVRSGERAARRGDAGDFSILTVHDHSDRR